MLTNIKSTSCQHCVSQTTFTSSRVVIVMFYDIESTSCRRHYFNLSMVTSINTQRCLQCQHKGNGDDDGDENSISYQHSQYYNDDIIDSTTETGHEGTYWLDELVGDVGGLWMPGDGQQPHVDQASPRQEPQDLVQTLNVHDPPQAPTDDLCGTPLLG